MQFSTPLGSLSSWILQLQDLAQADKHSICWALPDAAMATRQRAESELTDWVLAELPMGKAGREAAGQQLATNLTNRVCGMDQRLDACLLQGGSGR